MTDIDLTAMEPNMFGAQIEEGDTTVSLRVRITDQFRDDLQLTDVDEQTIVKESLQFLLEREKATSLPDELSLDHIARDHPSFYDELRARLPD